MDDTGGVDRKATTTVDYFEHRRIPFVVAVNRFTGARSYGEHDVSRARNPDEGALVVLCDARDRDSGKS